MKRILVILLVVAMGLGVFSGCGEGNSDSSSTPQVDSSVQSQENPASESVDTSHPSNLNMESDYPIVQDPITLKIMIPRSVVDTKGDPNGRWFWKWASKKMNINFEFDVIDLSVRDEKVNLMFVSNDLSDILLNMQLTNDEVAKYGAKESLLAPLNGLIETYGKNIKDVFDKEPAVKASSTYVDGNIYTLPHFSGWEDAQSYYTLRGWINNEWLSALNLSVPQTLDEFYETLTAFRNNDPNGNGLKDEIPFSYMPGPFSRYIYTSMGAVIAGRDDSTDDVSYKPAIYKGEVVIPANSYDLYFNYLTEMHKYYSEELLDPDIYTLTLPQVQAKAAEDIVGSHFNPVPAIMVSQGYELWDSLAPITSQYNDTKVWPRSINIEGGNFALSPNCENPEAAIRFADWFFSTEAALYGYYGPPQGSEDLLEGYEGWWFEEDQGPYYNLPEEYDGNVQYLINEVSVIHSVHLGLGCPSWAIEQVYDFKPAEGSPGASQYWRAQMNEKEIPKYYADVFPDVYYDVETNDRLKELEIPIQDFIRSTEAKFVIGVEPLSNYDNYVQQLKDLGIDELEQIYRDAYESYLSALS